MACQVRKLNHVLNRNLSHVWFAPTLRNLHGYNVAVVQVNSRLLSTNWQYRWQPRSYLESLSIYINEKIVDFYMKCLVLCGLKFPTSLDDSSSIGHIARKPLLLLSSRSSWSLVYPMESWIDNKWDPGMSQWFNSLSHIMRYREISKLSIMHWKLSFWFEI